MTEAELRSAYSVATGLPASGVQRLKSTHDANGLDFMRDEEALVPPALRPAPR